MGKILSSFYGSKRVAHSIFSRAGSGGKRIGKKFVSWLRQEYDSPFRVEVYVKSAKSIIAKDGEAVSGRNGGFFRFYQLLSLHTVKKS